MSVVTEADIEWRGETPFSPQFGDIYFSDQDGIAETQYVFLQQNDLPQRWLDKASFSILETGFGTGLNFFCTLEQWLKTAPEGAQLHYVSVEKHPLSLSDLKKLAAVWPQYAGFIEALIEVYPPPLSGFHPCNLLDGRVQLLLLWGDAVEQLSTLSFQADACYLDGFAPAKNADMWSPALFTQLARLLKQGASLSTFTAVGDVRRGLQQAGFDMKKTDAFGNKRHMLTGRLVSAESKPVGKPWFRYTAPPVTDKKAIVIGAGIAGITTAVALAQTGWQVTILERAEEVASAASGNLAGVVMPRLDKQLSLDSQFYWQAFYYAISCLQQYQGQNLDIDWHPSGVLQLAEAADNLNADWPVLLSARLDQLRASEVAGIPLKSSALFLQQAGYLSPRKLCMALLEKYKDNISVVLNSEVKRISKADNGWQLHLADKSLHSSVVVISNAHAATSFEQTRCLPLQAVRGQVSYLPPQAPLSALKTVVCDQSYIIPPMQKTIVIGATFQRDDEDCGIRQQDHAFNFKQFLQCVEPSFSSTVQAALPVSGRAAVRAVSPDRMPVVGALPDDEGYAADYADLSKGRPDSAYQESAYHQGLYINTGHGSRGLTSCFLAANYLAAMINHSTSPLPLAMAERLHPARFIIRQLLKGQPPLG